MTSKTLGLRAAALGLALTGLIAAAAAPALGEPTAPPGPLPHGQKDFKLASAGAYTLDSQHVGVIAAVSHVGFSYSIFRFGAVDGALTWDPDNMAKSSLKVSVKTASIETNVPKFAEQLAGDKYLKSAAFPDATFVSTAFRQTDATHGKVDGQFTLMGKTMPVTFDVTLVGAGSFFGQERIGVHAVTAINPQDYGMSEFFVDPIELTVDTEFFKGQMKLG